MANVLLCQGTALALPLRDSSVHVCVTSPPYYGLRSYGIGEGELGLEATLEAYVEAMVAVFREVKRVLRPDATLWLNMGDSYAQGVTGRRGETHTPEYGDGVYHRRHTRMMGKNTDGDFLPSRKPPPGIPAKNLLGMPWRLAFALQQDGWILRSDIIWDKPSCMPESVQDRPTRSHEYVFLFSKQARYFYDADAVREKTGAETPWQVYQERLGTGQTDHRADLTEGRTQCKTPTEGWERLTHPSGRNARTVWRIPSEPFSGSHFATFPPALVRRCLLAGASSAVCARCRAPHRRITETVGYQRQRWAPGVDQYHTQAKGPHGVTSSFSTGDVACKATTGFVPTCACAAGVQPATILDPFCGSGTTLLVARELGHHAIGIDLSYSYLHDIARQRLSLTALAAWEGRNRHQAPAVDYSTLPLFGVDGDGQWPHL